MTDNEKDVVTDASLLLNFLRIDRLDILGMLPGFRFHVLNHVVSEVIREPHVSRLQAGLAAGEVAELELTDLDAIADYDALRLSVGDGEAATIAAAGHLRWIVGMDEKGKARREAVVRVGEQSLLNTPGILVHAVGRGVLSLAEAEQIRVALAASNYHIKAFIADLL